MRFEIVFVLMWGFHMNGIKADHDLVSKFEILEKVLLSAREQDNMRINKLEDMLKQQQKLIDEQNEKYEALANLYNENKVKKVMITQPEEVIDTQLEPIQTLQNQLERYSTPDSAHATKHISANISSIVNTFDDKKNTHAEELADRDHKPGFNSENMFRSRNIRSVETPVAFTAVKIKTQDGIGANQNILFDNIILNDGGAFHVQHGVFIAPVAGYYLFSTSLLHNQLSQHFNAGIMHNGNLIVLTHAHNTGNFDQVTQTVVLKVAAGDEVWISNRDYEHESVFGAQFSSFTGILLFQL